mgnify:CR=1 FL=1
MLVVGAVAGAGAVVDSGDDASGRREGAAQVRREGLWEAIRAHADEYIVALRRVVVRDLVDGSPVVLHEFGMPKFEQTSNSTYMCLHTCAWPRGQLLC